MSVTASPMDRVQSMDRTEILHRAEALAAVFRENAAQGERENTVPDASWLALRESGLLGLITPPELGGIGADLQTFVDVVRTLARGDASHGWIASYLMQNSWYSARMGRTLRDELFDDRGYALVAGSGAARPTNAVERVEGGYRLTGRWSYASGCVQAEWLTLGGFVDTPEGREMTRFFVPVSDTTIHYDWAMSGMRGTGSHDVSADGVIVPEHRAVSESFAALGATKLAASEFDYLLMRYPALQVILLMHTAFLVGTAQAAGELFGAAVDRRFHPFSEVQPRDSAVIHAAYGAAMFKVYSALSLLNDGVRLVRTIGDAIGESVDEVTLEDRARLNLCAAGSIRLCVEAVRAIVAEAGSSVHKEGAALARILHDAEVIASHPTSDWGFSTESAGRVLLGKGLGPFDPAFF